MERESQKTFEHLQSQIIVLRQSFSTLADTLLEEIDALRAEQAANTEELATHITRNSKAVKTLRAEVAVNRTDATAATSALESRFEALARSYGVCARVWMCVDVCGCVWMCVYVCGCVWMCVGVHALDTLSLR